MTRASCPCHTNQWCWSFARYLAGSRLSAPSQPSQQRKTTWPETTTRAGVPIEPSSLFVTGQSFWRSASGRSSGDSCWNAVVPAEALGLVALASGAGAAAAFASARSEVAGRETGVQARLGVEQKRTGERDALARLKAPNDRVRVAAARAQNDLDAVEHAGHALDEDDLARAGVDDRRVGHAQHLTGRTSTRSLGASRSMPPHALQTAPGLVGRHIRMHRAPPAQPLIIGERPGLARLPVDRTTARRRWRGHRDGRGRRKPRLGSPAANRGGSAGSERNGSSAAIGILMRTTAIIPARRSRGGSVTAIVARRYSQPSAVRRSTARTRPAIGSWPGGRRR